MIFRVMTGIAVLIVTILIIAATKPKTFRIQRSISIAAPPERVFAFIDDFHKWPEWAPQDKEDPSMTRTYSGSRNGTGAECEWTSSGSAGKGRMLITESVPPTRISIGVDWMKPFVAHNANEFVLEAVGTSTIVTWTMQGPNLYVMKVMSVFVNMDGTMGKHFETGLRNLKAVVERGPNDDKPIHKLPTVKPS